MNAPPTKRTANLVQYNAEILESNSCENEEAYEDDLQSYLNIANAQTEQEPEEILESSGNFQSEPGIPDTN